MASSSNKRVRKSSPKSSAHEIMDDRLDPVEALRRKERLLQKKVHRMKVEMVANRLGFPMGSQRRLTFAQAAAKRRRFLVQAAEFITTAILFVGACSWLYQWWLSRQ